MDLTGEKVNYYTESEKKIIEETRKKVITNQNDLRQLGKKVEIQDILEEENKVFFYVIVDQDVYEVSLEGTTTMTVILTNDDGTTVSRSCTVTVQTAVAQIESTKYASVANAINAVPCNNVQTTIILLVNQTESLTIPANENVKFNLNNKTLSGKLTNAGTVTYMVEQLAQKDLV